MAVKKVPTRQCVGCRETKPKSSLIRVIKTADEEIVLDLTGKKNGRGAYICRDEKCLKAAVKNKGLERSLKTVISEEIYEELKKEMTSFDSQ
ncbi:MAG: YlxR family protein [Lachnospiraceae bacterium]|nr:YlxR family protein [Lachnospiraceae bacterium]